MRTSTLRISGAAGLAVATALGVAAALYGAAGTGSARPVLANGSVPSSTSAVGGPSTAAGAGGASSPSAGATATTAGGGATAKAGAPGPVSAAAAGSGARGATGCATPTPVPRPARATVVGRGTTATCTAAALRAALRSGGYVTFDCGGGPVTIAVPQEITTTGTTVIDGGGKVTLDGRGRNRIFVVGQGATLSVRNLRFVNGYATAANNLRAGGAIVGYYRSRLEVIGSTFANNKAGMGGGAVMIGTEGRLSIVRSSFSGNSSAYGGAVYSLLEPLTVVDSTFTGNSSTGKDGGGEGGAIVTDGGAPPTASSRGGQILLCGSTFSRNTARNSGGGVYLWGYARDRIVVQNSTFTGNSVSGLGGGLRASLGKTDYASTGTILISGTTVMSNTSTGNGGGLYLDCLSACDLQNSTFYRNTSKTYGGAVFGDGHHDNGVTYANNHAGGHGGALFGSRFVLNNTVFTGNTAGNPWGQAMSCSSTGTGAHVLQWLTTSRDGSTPCISGRVTSGNPQLKAPADNGGPTVTMMPSATSPVLRAGSGCLPRDQRGVARPAACTLGAVQRP